MEVNDLREAIVAVYASFYTFDISYHKEAKNTYLFFEKMFFDVPSKKLTHTLISCISTMQKL